MTKRFKVLALLFCIGFAFMQFSCKTAPKPEEVEPIEIIEEIVDDQEVSELESLHAKIEKTRQEAIDNSADSLYKTSFAFVEGEYEVHQTFVKTKIVEAEHIASAQRILNRYEALNYSALANKAKQRVDGFGFNSYDQAAYDKGLEKLSEAEKGYVADFDTEVQKNIAEEAYRAFQSILDKAFAELAKTKRQELIALRAEADAIKAGAADKSGYNSAMLKFTAGEEKYTGKEHEAAYNSYVEAYDALSELYQNVLTKRAQALKAMEEAKAKSEAVDKFALEADEIAPLADEEGSEE